MSKGFYTLLVAQFLSALADNALLFAAIALLQQMHAPGWHEPLLLQFFVISYIVLAPFVGSFADALPKGRVMFLSNGIKFFGSVAMILGMPPLYAYGIVGIGAAAYSPAKYGILTELLPPEKLVSANGWIEGSTVIAIILGAIIGGKMAGFPLELPAQRVERQAATGDGRMDGAERPVGRRRRGHCSGRTVETVVSHTCVRELAEEPPPRHSGRRLNYVSRIA